LQIERALSCLKELGARSVILFCHQNADPDSLCSAYALGGLLRRMYPSSQISIASPGGLSRLSRKIAQEIGISVTDNPSLASSDLVFLVDVNTVEQLSSWKEHIEKLSIPLFVVDHHAIHPDTERLATYMLVDEESRSTAEIVYRLWQRAGYEFDKSEALSIFLGIAYDTKHFAIARSDTFRVVVDLIDHGVDVEEALRLMAIPLPRSERVARLKAVSRIKIHRIGDWLVATSEIAAFQASAARVLLRVGADVAIVGGIKEGELRVSLRSTQHFFEKTHLHLGREVAAPLGREIAGAGGGHAMAAGFNGVGELETCLTFMIARIREFLLSSDQRRP